jgi:hypothetical protein
MEYRVYLYIKNKGKNEFVERVAIFQTQAEAAMETIRRNKEQGVNLSTLKDGDKFFMYKRIM